MQRPVAHAAFALALLASSAAHAGPGASSTDPAKVPAGRYVLDGKHASLTAKVKHMGFSNYTLRFTKLAADFEYDPKSPETTTLNVTVDPASLDTPTSAAFSKELIGDGWLEAARYPTITFVSTKVDVGDGHRGAVSGDLTFHGVTKPVTLDVVFNGVGSGMIPLTTRVGFSAMTTIKRSDFGVSRLESVVADDVTLNIEAEFEKK